MTASLRSDATALAALADLLGPTVAAGPIRRYAVLPKASQPRYVVPVAGRPAGAAHFRPSGSGRRDVLTRRVLSPALRLGLGRLLPGGLHLADGTDADPSLRRHLAALLDRPDLELVVALGAPRPNRKPVLQAVDGDGTTVAWVKVGIDDHTDALVAHETVALTERRPSPPVVTPEVRASGLWHGHPFLALGHMVLEESAGDLTLTAEAARALAGETTVEPVLESRWWTELRGIDPALDAEGRLAALLDAVEPELADRRWAFGAWHGDMAPWNATWMGDALVVWDWERSTAPVPLGLDLIHDRVQVAVLREGAELESACASALATERDTLLELGYEAEDLELVVSAYLITLRSRYLRDARHGSLGPGARIAEAIDLDPHLGRRATTP